MKLEIYKLVQYLDQPNREFISPVTYNAYEITHTTISQKSQASSEVTPSIVSSLYDKSEDSSVTLIIPI